MRKTPLVNQCYYHIYNRGNNRRDVFLDENDLQYFLDALKLFNHTESLGYSGQYRRKNPQEVEKIVSLVAYALNPNHFHLLLMQNVDNGISKFMQKLSTGYTMFFNKKYQSSGALFQGRFKSVLVEDDSYLDHLSAYINLNHKVHYIVIDEKYRSSFLEYVRGSTSYTDMCDKDIILDRFSAEEYQIFAENSVKSTLNLRGLQDDILME
ncbi:MAG: hypothetical protein Ctma_1388 [Catillopecten margaritatus gill symbiont]|uniref:Transposase IS200-like domain-containing protein n=1 Tax=Catillopecten margaritatus gill symbiont TaxID=3083288 RepID=A0AAU6PI45_9GAMM